jgi:hypothetical protein
MFNSTPRATIYACDTPSNTAKDIVKTARYSKYPSAGFSLLFSIRFADKKEGGHEGRLPLISDRLS